MARRSKLDRELDALAERFTPQIKAAFIASIRDIKSQAILQGIIDAIQVGDIEAAFRATGLSPAAMRPISAMIERAFETGGVTVANNVPKGVTDTMGNRAVFRFDVRNSRAEAWLRDHSSELVTRITEETKTNIRTIVQTGVRDGRNPRNIALDIVGRVNPDTGRRSGGVVGLTGPQEQWVANARRDLQELDAHYFTRVQRDKRFDSIVRKAIAEGKPLSAQKINAIVDKYSDNLLLQRGETIARTEAIQSLNKAADEAFRQAIDEGTLAPNAVKKIWDSAGDNRVRASHAAMEAQAVQMDEPFVTPDGARLMFPGDTSLGAPGSEVINCRCRVRHEVDWFADLDDDDEPPAPPVRVDLDPVPPLPPTLPPVPVVEPPGLPYERFQPLRTIAEAEEWSRENLAENVQFTKGVKMPGLNDILRASQEVIDRFALPKMRYMGDPKGDDRRWKFNPKAIASFAMQSDTFLFRNYAADINKIVENMVGDAQAVQSVRNLEIARANRAPWIAPGVREGLQRMERIEWAVSKNSAQVTYHEMGHRLHGQKMAEITALMQGENWINEGWPYLISRYSATNIKEYVAESFSLYMQGDETQFWRIHPRLLAYFKQEDRKNVRT